MPQFLETLDGDLVRIDVIDVITKRGDGEVFAVSSVFGIGAFFCGKSVKGVYLKGSFEEIKALLLGDTE